MKFVSSFFVLSALAMMALSSNCDNSDAASSPPANPQDRLLPFAYPIGEKEPMNVDEVPGTSGNSIAHIFKATFEDPDRAGCIPHGRSCGGWGPGTKRCCKPYSCYAIIFGAGGWCW
ncbi:hypothetical protein ONZ45_g9476 [Pleurotus djamor]|nr:hypothetical protein ONZ45_g9476 [Pleurotus djamor]